MEIKILGKGCPKCKRLEQIAHEALTESGIAATILHVTDLNAITAYPILSTPGLVINEEVKSSGRLPRTEEVVAWIREAAAPVTD
ncbi:MAG: thioredoxin family protein [Chloroflexi bacterium]|nr:thioredoxin family protein [Chloroflexota bacterium]